MEKQYKPLPDVECLKYHGTPEKPDIKIFVSHRIDLDSETIDNPLYIPVRCGAVYDQREDITMLGDDTGDNISEKRESFCEFTVMYWAWKNIKADYYGLCHYRRFLSFSDKTFSSATLKQGIFDSMSQATLEKCRLTDVNNIRKKIVNTDAIVPFEYELKDAESDATISTIKEFWLSHHLAYLKEKDFDQMMELIEKNAPEYYNSALEYTKGKSFYGFNCFIMKKDLFDKMCRFIFSILPLFDASLDKSHYSSTQKRAAGYMGEWLFSIFIYHIKKHTNAKVEERQLLAFQDTSKAETIFPAFQINNVPIALTATDANRPLLSVQIQSIISHMNKNNNYDFIILRRSYNSDKWKTYLLKQQDALLLKMIESIPNVSIRFYDPKEELGDIECREWDSDINEELYYLLFIPWIFQNFEKVIFIRDGLLAQTDVSNLLETNMADTYIAATKDYFFAALLNGYDKDFYKFANKTLKMKNSYDYISTDILLFHTEKIRLDYSIKDIFSTMATLKKRKLKNFAVDVFNIYFEGKISFISQLWNKISCWGPDYFFLEEYIPGELMSQLSGNAYMINIRGINGRLLPQQSSEIKSFWEYAKLTPFYEEILLSMCPNWAPSIFDIQRRMGLFDTRSGARKLADKLLPKGTRRREFAKFLLPKGSLRWRFCKQIYYIFRPQYRPVKENQKDKEKWDD